MNRIRGGSRTAAPSRIEHFVIIVNGRKQLTIITKRSILDVAAVLDPSLRIRIVFSLMQIYSPTILLYRRVSWSISCFDRLIRMSASHVFNVAF